MNTVLRYSCLALLALSACASKPRLPLLDIGQGSYMRGPITIRDDSGWVVLWLPPGSEITDGPEAADSAGRALPRP